MRLKARPDRESEISWVTLAWSCQKTAVDAPRKEEVFCLDPGDVGMKPPEEKAKKNAQQKQ